MQTILGSGGAIGEDLAKELINFTSDIRLVSRNPKKVNNTDELFPADLTDARQVDKAVEGSEIVYLVIGFPYKTSVWKKNWPPLMRNTVEACKKHNAKLVFFDNVYMYDRDHLAHMTEETPVRPTSKKGQIRAQIASMLLEETKKGKLSALIARAPDFYGPKNSVLIEMGVKKLLQGKAANWFADANKIHSFIYTPDAAKATAILGNTPEAYNQVWHLPTIHEKLTGKQWIELFSRELGVEPKIFVMRSPILGMLGIFVPILKEFKEMVYQYDRDYYFDSSKFERKFGMKPTEPGKAAKMIIEALKGS